MKPSVERALLLPRAKGLSIQNAQLIKSKWDKKSSQAVDPATTSRFHQVENKLESIIGIEAAASVPLASPAR